MSSSNEIGRRLITATQVAGVLAGGWFVWINIVLPRLGLRSPANIAAQALLYVGLAWLCGAAVTFSIYVVVSMADLPYVIRCSAHTSAAAMWFAPAIVLLSLPFSVAYALGIFLVVNATRHLFSKWVATDSPITRIDPARAEPAQLFRFTEPGSGFISWSSIPVFMGPMTAQAAVIAMLWRHPFEAAVLLAMSTAILTSLVFAAGAYQAGNPPALPHSTLSVVWTLLLAAAVTFGGIAAHGRRGRGTGTSSGSPQFGGRPVSHPFTRLAAPPAENLGIGGEFPGVILLPQVQPYTMLFVPVLSPRKFGTPFLKPVGIPFSGEYRMFRWPATRPPPRSIIRRGSASELAFRTTDGVPIEMEARQKLDPPVAINCCRAIQLAIVDADHYPGTVSLEVILIDSASVNTAQSLGTIEVGSGSPEQKLTFSIPATTPLRKFDELKVVFHRQAMRADKSARVAIERFVLLP